MENKKIVPLTNSFDQNTDYQMSLQDYVILIKIHYKLILLFTLTGLVIGLYKNINNIPIYRTTASIVLKEAKASNLEDSFDNQYFDQRS